MRVVKFVLVICGVAVFLSPRTSGQDSALPRLLEKASGYVSSFERQLSGVVAEETYVQVAGSVRRELKSDLLMVPVATDALYVQFRDVFEVDGRPVRDRQERLTQLFTEHSDSASAQLRAITEESARYNIGNVQRTVNIPTLALVFLRADNQQSGTFALTNRSTPSGTRLGLAAEGVSKTQWAEFVVFPTNTRVLAFKEARHNTLIRGSAGRDLPSDARYWLDPATGGVLMTELTADDGKISAVIDVRYRPQPAMDGAMMPAEMRETYTQNFWGAGPDVLGRATYDHFRTFQVTTSTDDVKVK